LDSERIGAGESVRKPSATGSAYSVSTGDAALELTLEEREGGLFAVIDGRAEKVVFSNPAGATSQQVTVGGRELRFAQRRTPEGIEIVIDGAVYAVTARDARAVRYAGLVKKPAGASKQTVKAPMPGLIVTVPVKVGDVVAKDQTLVTLNAMKLENDIRAASGGTVQSVHVEPGQPVEKGALLVIIG
jgi:biotin carboxyl carrier protein